jgi:hypothetical protein
MSFDTNAQVGWFAGQDFDPALVQDFDPARISPQHGRKFNPLVQLARRVKNCTLG